MAADAKKRKSWREKLVGSKDLPRVVEITGKMVNSWGSGTMVIPAPLEVDELMRKVPKGRLVTISQLRAALAQKHRATIACPITTGIFAWIAAHAAVEDQSAGRKRITPYWRTLKAGGVINEKYPGGVEEQKKLLEAEGHTVMQKGSHFIVADHEKHLVRL